MFKRFTISKKGLSAILCVILLTFLSACGNSNGSSGASASRPSENQKNTVQTTNMNKTDIQSLDQLTMSEYAKMAKDDQVQFISQLSKAHPELDINPQITQQALSEADSSSDSDTVLHFIQNAKEEKSSSSTAANRTSNQSDDMSYVDFIKMSDTNSYNYLNKLLKAHPEITTDPGLIFEELRGDQNPSQPDPRFVGKTVMGAIQSLIAQSSQGSQPSSASQANPSSNSSAGATSTSTDPKDKAVELVKAYLESTGTSTSPKTIVEYDHMAGKYYIIHVYDIVTDHTATIGWYGVDVAAGKVTDITLDGESILK